MGKSVYEIITNKIIEKLEAGVVPWRKPFNNNGVPGNWKTQKAYRGINALTLEPGEYASKKQILEAGGRIKKEELKNSHIGVASGKCGFTTLRKSKYKKSNFSVL
ncbi:ArdC-like ssDNA-binding domain-containing protein [Bacillus subtilis]